MLSNPLAQSDVDKFVSDFKTRGYGIVRKAFTQDVAVMKARFDAWYADCLQAHGDVSTTTSQVRILPQLTPVPPYRNAARRWART